MTGFFLLFWTLTITPPDKLCAFYTKYHGVVEKKGGGEGWRWDVIPWNLIFESKTLKKAAAQFRTRKGHQTESSMIHSAEKEMWRSTSFSSGMSWIYSFVFWSFLVFTVRVALWKGPGHDCCGAKGRRREVGNEDESRGDKFTPLCRAALCIAAGVYII